ncbi:lipopolysaccharide/colanic/teichoic acid biosynthesis glycosyltransferase [Barrientosiimonas humi]|uniref:Lipopolysaccharide/colanic/teichoic acid biosynthesis glycosyltransferase n=1 Tax=Barrientosiimonas humi TaxID=999931 RepID=A0A542XE79_9MICO|nr:sugar transferase [Barrientosiimonas humi]TQL34086.1 lipopolysaccharide/colanic/teichoic acid biosynthesis glycosyltransferase [Barrientosiimonas humi]CAG7574076.1 putative sugar transferase EpsL [Barrientosiimonas humi]
MTRRRVTKRLLDLALGVPALVVSLPIQAAVAVAVRRQLGSPVLFRQTRPGLHGEPFEMVKFRTMLPVDEAAGLVTDDDRLTAFGLRLRATSLDELPALWNVVKGDMSLVGPRPLLMRYLERYSPDQARRHDVRPGLTGLAQINGRNTVSWEQRFALDVDYVDSHTTLGDLRIMLATISSVLRRDGISGEGTATMAEFMGAAPTPPLRS